MDAMNATAWLDKMYEMLPDAWAIERAWFGLVGVAGTVIGVVGIVLNLLSLCVWSSKEMKSTSGTYLIALAVYDLVFLLLNTVFVSTEYLHFGLTENSDYFTSFVKPSVPVHLSLTNIAITGSVYTTIALTIDRAIGVVRPLQWPSICTRRRVKIVQLMTSLWSILLNVPFMMEMYIGLTFDREMNATRVDAIPTEYAQSYFHTEIYLRLLNPILDSGVPVLVVAVTNVIIVCALRRQRKSSLLMRVHSRSGTGTTESGRITAQILFISVFTLVSRSLRVAMLVVMEHHDTLYVNECPLYCGVLAATAHFFNILNATVNFFCYCYFGNKFRHTCWKMFCPRRIQKLSPRFSPSFYQREQSKTYASRTMSRESTTSCRMNSIDSNVKRFPSIYSLKDFQSGIIATNI